MQNLIDEITRQLAAPRAIAVQVLDALLTQHQQTETTLPHYLQTTLPTLDDTDIDLLMSPAFTPTFDQRSACIALLADKTLTNQDQASLVTALDALPAQTTFTLPDGSAVTFTVPEVCLQRYVRLMQLNRAINPDVYQQLQAQVKPAEQPVYQTLARDVAWTGREAMLQTLLPVLVSQPSTMARQMTDFVRTYRPDSLSDLDRHLESYIRSCESDLNRAGEMSFHDERLKEKYVLHSNKGFHHQHDHEESVRANYLQMMDRGRAMRELLQQVNRHAA
jgi:hypothetical protein